MSDDGKLTLAMVRGVADKLKAAHDPDMQYVVVGPEVHPTPEEGEWPKRDAEQSRPSVAPANVALCAQHVGGAAQQVPVASAHPSPTEAMLVRGKEARALYGLGAFASAVTEEEAIYRAMVAVAPVDLVSVGELAALRERDEALAKAAHFEAEALRLANGPPTRHPPEFVAKVLMDREGRHDDPMALARLTEVIRCARLDGRKQARDEIADKDARIAELKTILAEKVKSETPSDTKPAPAPKEFPAGALKSNGSDPRRMGPT